MRQRRQLDYKYLNLMLFHLIRIQLDLLIRKSAAIFFVHGTVLYPWSSVHHALDTGIEVSTLLEQPQKQYVLL